MPSPVAMMTMVHKCSALTISTQAMGFAKRGGDPNAEAL